MTFHERYKYNPQTDLLGKGGFARVYKALDTQFGGIRAIKVFTSDNKHYTIIEEIKKVIEFNHPNLLRYYDVAVLQNTNVFGETEEMQAGIMEYANAGDLKSFVQKNPNSNLLFDLLQQVLKGLEYLHNKGIIHRDLKPQNILLQDDNGKITVKISDFGISKNIGDPSSLSFSSAVVGTIEYMAPEQFNPNKYGINGKIATNVDLWSFGIMVHELITNEPPFGQRNGNTTAEQIMSSILSANLPEEINNISEPYQTIIKKCLVADAKFRIKNANELLSFFENKNDLVNNFETQVTDKKQEKNNITDYKVTETLPITLNESIDTRIYEIDKTPRNDSINKKNKKIEDKDTEGESIKGGCIFLISTIIFGSILIYGIAYFLPSIESFLKDLRTPKNYARTELFRKIRIDDSLYNIGKSYYFNKNYDSAKIYFKQSLSDDRSLCMLGNIFFYIDTKNLNLDSAKYYYELSADKGNTVAMYELGLVYKKENYLWAAKKMFEKVIEKNDNVEAVTKAQKELSTIKIDSIASLNKLLSQSKTHTDTTTEILSKSDLEFSKMQLKNILAIRFDDNSSKINETAKSKLNSLGQFMKENPSQKYIIYSGLVITERNSSIAYDRISSVIDFFTVKFGISRDRFIGNDVNISNNKFQNYIYINKQ